MVTMKSIGVCDLDLLIPESHNYVAMNSCGKWRSFEKLPKRNIYLEDWECCPLWSDHADIPTDDFGDPPEGDWWNQLYYVG